MLETPGPDQQTKSGEPRSTFLRPWSRGVDRDQMLMNMQQGFTTLTQLMGAIRDNLEKQTQRQDELLTSLAKLPDAVAAIPESQRVQSETLRAINVQLTQQNSHQEKLTEILNKVGEVTGDQSKMLDGLRESVDGLHKHDEAITDNLTSVGSAMQSLSRNSQTSAQVLEGLREKMQERDSQMEKILHRQATRFTTLLAIAIFLSIAAIAAVAVVGVQLLNRGNASRPVEQPSVIVEPK